MSACTPHYATVMRRSLSLLLIVLVAATAPAAERDTRQQLIDHARGKVLRSIAALEQYLSQGGASVVAGWGEYLHLEALKAEMNQPTPDAARLHELCHGFYAAQEGLEKERFLALRDSLRHYNLVASTPEGDLRQNHAAALQRVEVQVKAYRQSDARDDVQTLGTTLAWLEATGADKAAIARVRNEFGYPNAYVRVSSRLANYFLTRPVVERERVSATLNGTFTTGDAVTRGTLWLNTAPQTGHGAIDIRLTGQTTTSNSVSQHGPVTIYGSAVTSIDARVRLTMHDDLLRVEPPVVRAVTKSHISDIEANRRIIERLAWRRVPKETPAAEQAAARHVEQKLSERLQGETTKLIAQANDLYANKVRLPMKRRGAWPAVQYSSDGDSLHLRLHQASPYQVAAPNAPPQWPVAGDLTMAGHESMFENMFEGIFAGREIEDKRFLYLMELLTGEAPRALWVHDREPRWSVIMAEERPLRLRMREEQLRVTLAIAETVRGAERYEMPALVTGVFTAAATSDGPVFRRQGDLVVEFPEREKHSANAEELRSFLTRKFAALMPEELYFDGLSAPAGGFGDKLNQLTAREISFQSGWATIRYQLDMSKKPKTTLVTTTGIGG